MQYCTLKQNPVWTPSQVPQGGSQFMQDASQTQQTWNTNVIHQYNGPNSRVQQLQSFSVSHGQAHLYRQTTSQNSAGVAPSHRSANKKSLSPLLVSLLCDKRLQNDNQTSTNQNPSSTIGKNTTPSQHVVSAEWQQSNASSYSQHSGLHQGYYQSSNSVVAGATAALDPRQQWVHPKTSSTAGSFLQQGNYGRNSSPNGTQGYSTGYPANVGIPTHQPVANNGPTMSPGNTQLLYLPNTNLQTNQHSGQLSARRENSENVSSNLNYYCPPPPPYSSSSSHLFNLPRTSNQIVPSPATILHNNYNGNVAQPPPLLPETPQSVSPSNMLIPLPQTSLSNNASIGSVRAGSGGGQSVHVSPPSNNIVPERNPVTSSSDGSQPLQTAESVSSQRAPKEKLIAQIRHWLEDLAETHKQKMSSKAVAVVQPLSQESGNISTNTTSGLITPEKGQVLPTGIKNGCVYQSVDVGLDTEHPTAKRSNEAVPNTNTNTNSGSEQQQSEVSHRKSPQCLSRGRKKANTTPLPAPAAGLSALPTATWTAAALKDFIQETEKSQAIPADSQSDLPGKFQHLFEEVIQQNINNSHKFILTKIFLLKVKHFCDQHVTPDTVVLSQVKEGFEKQLKHYHVLGDEPYSEQPFKSLWLNVNEKLDDIDKEFGFPWTLRRHFYVDESDSQKDEENNQNSFSKPTIKEVPEEIQPVSEVAKDQPSSVQSSPTPTAPDSAGEDSTDPNYSFKIQVLTPEEAKALYEEVQKDHHSTGGQKETAEIDHVKTDTPTDATSTGSEATSTGSEATSTGSEATSTGSEATSTGSEAENLPVDPIDHICCLGKFMEMNLGLNTPSVKCQCKEKQKECKSTDKDLVSDSEIQENVVEDECELSEELPTELCEIIDLTEDDKPDPAVIEKPTTVDELSDTDVASSAEDDEPSNGCGFFEEIPDFVIKLSESEEESSTEEGISSQTAPSSSSDDRTKQAEPLMLSSPAATVPLQTPEEDDEGEQPSSKSNDETVCEEVKDPPNIGPKTMSKKLTESCFRNVLSKRKQRSLCTFSSSLKEVQGPTTENKSVKLVLFGSANQEKCRSPAIKIGHHSSPTLAPAGAQQPPQVVSVNVESSQKNLEEAAYSRKPSVKQLIYEKWSKSFPSCYRNKMKRQRSFSASVPKSQKNKRQSSSERRDSDGKGKVSLRRKRTKSLPNAAVGVQEAKRRRYSVSLGQTAQRDERNTDHEVVKRPMPLQENIVLKFSMLPSTFTFRDGSNVGTEGNNGVSGQTESVNNKQSPADVVKTIKSNKEHWCHSPNQHSEPPKIPKNSNLFEEYQKKYQEKNQTLTNK